MLLNKGLQQFKKNPWARHTSTHLADLVAPGLERVAHLLDGDGAAAVAVKALEQLLKACVFLCVFVCVILCVCDFVCV